MGKNEVLEINQIKLDGALTILNLNAKMESLESLVVQELEKAEYNSIVTMDNFKVMKESSLYLGKVAKDISDFRIAKVKEETQDIKIFEDSLKRFISMFKSKQDEIKQGLDIFEEETRKQVKAVCIAYFDDYSLEVCLSDEFKNVNLEDMTQTGFMTASGAISKKGKEEVEKRVQVQLNLQNKVQNRLMMLENECLKAGIEPLTIEHVQGFLFETDERYETKLKVLIDAEIKRSEVAKIKVQAETRKAVAEEKTPFDDCPPPQDSEIIKYASCGSYQELEQPIKKEAPVVAEDGKIEKTLSIKISVPAKATDEQIISAVIKMIKADTLPVENIEVR